MDFKLRQANREEIDKILSLFKLAAEKIAKMNIDYWQYWTNPPIEKVNWVKEGLLNHEFFFIESFQDEIIGMVRIMDKDLLYWGEMNDKAKYVHSLVISEEFEGHKIGKKVLERIENEAGENNYSFLRLDCDSKNVKLCRYYENQGFLKVGEKTLPLSIYNLYQKQIS
ncbi:GNAT family N-acetyltransferase [Albibacterium sp.]|uniref:GNAT family N-acetyltransferase n=1 Tax=Albibacterium sp. TaxID=2952885 RepID=UPI002B52F77B|nr:GNAT family N-acetyltransferase [Albibacterium sp.]HUH18374.1 GNAT family N-acetyltransferase [Albibacterium sp.]